MHRTCVCREENRPATITQRKERKTGSLFLYRSRRFSASVGCRLVCPFVISLWHELHHYPRSLRPNVCYSYVPYGYNKHTVPEPLARLISMLCGFSSVKRRSGLVVRASTNTTTIQCCKCGQYKILLTAATLTRTPFNHDRF